MANESATINAGKTKVFHKKLFGTRYKLFNQDSGYFTLHTKQFGRRRKKAILGSCKLCAEQIKGYKSNYVWFTSHLRLCHPTNYAIYCSTEAQIKNTNPKLKKEKIYSSQAKDLRRVKEYIKKRKDIQIAQANKISNFNENILQFIVNFRLPLTIVENLTFITLFDGTQLKDNIPSIQTIQSLLTEKRTNFDSCMTQKLSEIDYICTTADLCYHGIKLFFGYTCHWIDNETLQRHSAALAYRYFYDKEDLKEIHTKIRSNFGLDSKKIVCSTTDNGFNYIPLFKEFGINLDDNSIQDISNSSMNFAPIWQTCGRSKYFRSVTHKLNLIALEDFISSIKEKKDTLLQHMETFNRCSNFWKKYNGGKCSLLSLNKWNTLYNNVIHLLEIHEKKPNMCNELNIEPLRASDVEYLNEYVELMKPIAEAINFLDLKKNSYFGYLIPTLVSIKVKLKRLNDKELKFLNKINTRLEVSLLQRFETYFKMDVDSWDAIIAAVVCPKVKLKFLKVLNETATQLWYEEDVKQSLLRYSFQFAPEHEEKEYENDVEILDTNFFDFGDNKTSIERNIPTNTTLSEINRYLLDCDENTTCLHRYPTIKKLFLKYNTPIHSSGQVEKMFSFAWTDINSKNQDIPDTLFEDMVLTKANSNNF